MSPLNLIDQAKAEATQVLRACVRPQGFFASGLPGGYEAVWARDSMITALGAMTLGDEFQPVVRASLALLLKNQSQLGQIPNCVGSYNLDRRSDVTFNSIDSSLWLAIGLVSYVHRYHDHEFFIGQRKFFHAALAWLAYQDPDEVGLLAQQPTMDWMDAFPHKYGYCINTQALYYGALILSGQEKQAHQLQKIVNGAGPAYLSLYDAKLGFYYPWAWKNHDNIREHETWFDSLGNILAVVTGLASPKIATSILAYIDRTGINRPYPVKCLWPPIKQGDPEWHDYFANCDAREPNNYLNAGIWPMIGGFYVAALVKTKQYQKAAIELEKLAAANLQILTKHDAGEIKAAAKAHYLTAEKLKITRSVGFNEWLQGKSGLPMGEPYQAWSAGAYLYAFECVKNKRVGYF